MACHGAGGFANACPGLVCPAVADAPKVSNNRSAAASVSRSAAGWALPTLIDSSHQR
jgi:hypothetical protein